ncbi:MAG: GtrA family protein [Oscillospiraceae bacterium]|nr:GtrA family protein [Oscillospiraceae bacterium]
MRIDKNDPRIAELWRFVKFGITGVMNTAVDFFVFTVLSWVGVGIYLAQVISYSAGMLNSYIVNRKWTFQSKGSFVSAQMIKFVVVNLALLCVSLVVLKTATGFGLHKLIAKLCATAVTMVLGFIINRLWVFKEKN